MKQYVFFAFAAIAAVALAGFAFQMYRSGVSAPPPVLIAEVSRALKPLATSLLAIPTSEVGFPKSGREVEPPREVQPTVIEESVAASASGDPTPPETIFNNGEAEPPREVQPPIIEELVPQPAPEPEPAFPPPAPAPAPVRIMISEILYDAAGSDEGKEFIELYNSGETEINLDGWSLSNGDKTLIKIGSAENDRVKIPARGFFLIGFNKYTGAADAVRSAALPNTSAAITLHDKEGATVEEMGYGGDLKVEKNSGSSLERRAWEGEVSFSVQSNPNPQNSATSH